VTTARSSAAASASLAASSPKGRLMSGSASRMPAAIIAAKRGTSRRMCGLAALPDGRWDGWDMSDCDGVEDSEEYRVQVEITKRADRLEVASRGSSRRDYAVVLTGGPDADPEGLVLDVAATAALRAERSGVVRT
jgi:hypothetical protein